MCCFQAPCWLGRVVETLYPRSHKHKAYCACRLLPPLPSLVQGPKILGEVHEDHDADEGLQQTAVRVNIPKYSQSILNKVHAIYVGQL